MYPTRKLVVPQYGWTVETLEASLYELEDLKAVLNDDKAFSTKLVGFIVSWDCVDKQNNPLPISAEGLKKLPQSALRFVIESVTKPFQDDGIKNGSA